jgi:uncharacterized protein (UPF0333 family)
MLLFARTITGFALLTLLAVGSAAQAQTYVYVSNAEDSTIGTYAMATDGTLTPGARV